MAVHATPTVLQMEAVECGAASLAMVLGYHGRWVPLEELRLRCGVTRDGSKAGNVLRAARQYGLTARGFKKEPGELRAMPLPAVVFWNFNHFLVLEGFARGKVHVNDPAAGRRVVSEAEFDQAFTGVVLTFEPGEGFAPGGQRPSTFDALARRFDGLGGPVAYLVALGMLLVVPGLVIPVFSSVFIDKVLLGGLDSWLRPLLLGMLLTAVLRMLLTWLQGQYLLRIRTRIALTRSAQFFWHVLRLPVEFYTQRAPGEIGARVAINDRIASLLSGELAGAALALLQTVFFAALMLAYDLTLTLVSVAIAGLNLVVMRVVGRRTEDAHQVLAMDAGRLSGVALNGLTALETLKSSGAEDAFFARWAGHQAKYVNAAQAVARVGWVFGAIPGLLGAINAGLLIGIGGMRVMEGAMTIGMLVAFQSLSASFNAPVQALASLARRLLEVRGDMMRVDDVLQYPLDPMTRLADVAAADGSSPVARLEGAVELSQVEFGYSRGEPALLQAFDLQLRPGERAAVVGPSGCGKSTLAKLLLGLYAPWSGSIRFDGRPREDFGRLAFASSVALVDQDILLFEGTVRDNLTLWDGSVSEQDMVQAARDACIHDVIMARPGGYDAPVTEGGGNFSGGQRQRIEIARALVGNPRLLVLDEATSALDAETELAIDHNLRRRGCTCVVIAHRLSTIRDADEIVVLERGRVVERGRHDGLMQRDDGFYRRLVGQY